MSKHRYSTTRRLGRGFTLLELMITIAVAAVLAAIAVPNMRDFMRNNRLTAASNDLLHSFQLARSEAVKRLNVVAVCASANPMAANPACSNGAFSGWITFQDSNNNWGLDAGEEILQRQVVADGVTVVNDNDGIVSYASTGFANSTPGESPSSAIVICDVRGNEAIGSTSTARTVLITGSGRVRVSRAFSDVTSALATIGGTCP
jgi:type IV fimbrial biogenesis protein FimT